MTQALTYQAMSAFYGTSQILHGVDFEVRPGEVVCLLGLNGMGKTTTLRATMGLVDRIEGRITLNGAPLDGPTHRRSQMGVTLVPEDRKVFANLTVEENLRVAIRKPARGAGFGTEDAIRIFPRLGERLGQKGGTLSGGEQQMLVVARAMLANPHYMMLDEPTEGLAPSYVDAIRDSIVAARGLGIGVLLVEQSLPLAQAVGDHFHVIENGQIVKSFLRE
ncbi:MAG: ABC transporter ATP-binding protein, partial [Bauldia sp.]